jgi:2-aminoadipate transaminase
MKMALERPNLISLAAGFTDNASLPVEKTTRLLRQLLIDPKIARASLQYGSTAGDLRLRELTTARLRLLDGMTHRRTASYKPENTIITHGSQQLLYLLTESLCDPGDIVLVEDPTYFVYLGILQSHGISARGILLRSDGLDLEQLQSVLEELKSRALLPRVKLLYLVSYFQNPSGVTTSAHKKAAALEILRRYEKDAGHPIYLLEDAAYRELRFQGPEIPSGLTFDPKRVIYTGTYSKPFATGIRVGYGCLPEPLLTVVTRVKGNHDFGTSHLLQQILRAALENNSYEKHVHLLQSRYARKAKVMTDAIRHDFPDWVQWEMPSGGLYVWARTPRKISTDQKSKLFSRALARGVLYVPGDLCYAEDPTRRKPRNQMRISFGSATEIEIREGIKRLGAVLRSCA